MVAVRRHVLTPQWLAVHGAVFAVVVAFIALGLWQLDRARAEAEPTTAEAGRAAVPLTTLTTPGQQMGADAVGRLATVTGQYDAGQQFLVERGSARWVVTMLRTADGAGVPVVRGSTEGSAAPPESGEVTVTGWLQPPESGTMTTGSINSAELIQQVPYDLYPGYLVLTEQQPPSTGDLQVVEAPRTSADEPGFPLQNAAYAIQWWLFAAFAVFLWWRTVRDAIRVGGPPAAAPAQIPAQKRAAHE